MPKDYSDYTLLLESLKNNDLEAFEYLYTTSRNRLYALANSIIDDEEISKDLVQELFIDFLENRQFEKVHTALKTYLYNTVRNKALKVVRERAVRLRQNNRLILEIHSQVPTEKTEELEYNMDKEEIRNEIETAIGNLPPMAEKVFRMHYLQHITHAEIAEKLGITKSTVSSHMDRALKGLRSSLKKNS